MLSARAVAATNWECYATRVGGRRLKGLFQPTPTVSPLGNPLGNPPEAVMGAMEAMVPPQGPP